MMSGFCCNPPLCVITFVVLLLCISLLLQSFCQQVENIKIGKH